MLGLADIHLKLPGLQLSLSGHTHYNPAFVSGPFLLSFSSAVTGIALNVVLSRMPTPTGKPSSSLLQRVASNTLGARLNAVFELVCEAQLKPASAYDKVWDCCCDHGYLGAKLLAAGVSPAVAFVDQQAHIIEQLAAKLQTLDDGSLTGRYEALACDAGTLNLLPGLRHLVILAGVGGEHIVDILAAIHTQHPAADIDYILCPTTTQFDLREYLVAEDFDLQHEQLVAEKGRDYEVILTSRAVFTGENVTLVGNMWDPKNPDHLRYQNKLIQHYERQTLGRDKLKAERAKRALAHYQNCFSGMQA